MNFKDYQKKALDTDQAPSGKYREETIDTIVPILGLAGEAGELLSEYKKHLRDGDAHKLFKERVKEELGDMLWYVANLATKFELDLNDVAVTNLDKVKERWQQKRRKSGSNYFDRGFPPKEQLPRKFEITIEEVLEDDSPKVRCFFEGRQVGDNLTDNSHYPDGYRFHDVFHFAYAAFLGWSPVTRSVLRRKRKSNPKVDEVEDGGRAIAIEEGVSALVFSYAEAHDYLKKINELDYSLLKTIDYLTSRLEVNVCSTGDWERAILVGYDVWRQVCDNNGGKVIGDLDNQTLVFEKLKKSG